ncbi:unnamed protein product [Cladocopium goreaui]|uniref:Mitochondrial fission process protein 1 n=1 Tax=Cladocopium goreaui TaxID=2562237 RepID=A0A9P1FUS6_9DINO|nr:unnamed protein product [Cladocopium goreaui]
MAHCGESRQMELKRGPRPPWFLDLQKNWVPILCQANFFTGDSKAEVISKELEETALRYLPYVARAKRLLLSSHRYIAYSSDVGESLRPVIKPWQVNLSYGIAGAYVLADTGLAGYRRQQQVVSRWPPPASTPPPFRLWRPWRCLR